jgi:hypothetical protein
MATSLDVPLDDLIKSRNGRGRGRGRGQGGARGRGDGQRLARGSWRGRGAGTFRGRGLGVLSRRPLGVNTWSSSFATWRGRGAGTFRGRGLGVPSRRPLGVNTWSSSFAIAKARTKLSLFLSISRIQITVDTWQEVAVHLLKADSLVSVLAISAIFYGFTCGTQRAPDGFLVLNRLKTGSFLLSIWMARFMLVCAD